MLTKELAAQVAADYRAMIRMAKHCESAEEYYVHLEGWNAAFGICWYISENYGIPSRFIYQQVSGMINNRTYIYASPEQAKLGYVRLRFTLENLKKCLQARVDWLHEKFGV